MAYTSYSLTTTGATPATGIAQLSGAPLGTLSQYFISGTYGTVTFRFDGTFDGTTWFPVAATLMADRTPASGTISPSDNTSYAWELNTAGMAAVRLYVISIASGTVAVEAQTGSYVGVPPMSSNNISTYGAITASGAITGASSIKSTSPTAGIGYATGAGGAVTQATNRTTGVTLNTICGAITLISAAGSATPASFTVTNSAVAALDTVIVSQKSGTDLYEIFVTAVAAGSFKITSFTTGGTTTEQPVFNFAVIKAVVS